MTTWRKYIGLPHALGADPDEGKGADCVLLTFKVLDELGAPHPEPRAEWFDMASADRWRELSDVWDASTRPLDTPEEGAVTLIKNGKHGLGVAVVIDHGLLLVHHRRGVVWVPLHLMKALNYARFV